MLPKHSLFFFLISLCLAPSTLWAETPDPQPKNPILNFYQTVISPVDGDRCPMHPTCSQYAAQCFKKHGVVMGWIMTMDRLVRCGRDEKNTAPTITLSGRKKIHDPVSHNDFWWVEP